MISVSNNNNNGSNNSINNNNNNGIKTTAASIAVPATSNGYAKTQIGLYFRQHQVPSRCFRVLTSSQTSRKIPPKN